MVFHFLSCPWKIFLSVPVCGKFFLKWKTTLRQQLKYDIVHIGKDCFSSNKSSSNSFWLFINLKTRFQKNVQTAIFVWIVFLSCGLLKKSLKNVKNGDITSVLAAAVTITCFARMRENNNDETIYKRNGKFHIFLS